MNRFASAAEYGLENADRALGLARKAMADRRLETRDLALALLACKGLEGDARRSPEGARWCPEGIALGALIHMIQIGLPVDDVARQRDWELPEFLTGVVEAAEALLVLFAEAVEEWRYELQGAEERMVAA